MPSLPLRLLLQIFIPRKQARRSHLLLYNLVIWQIEIQQAPLDVPQNIRRREVVLPNFYIFILSYLSFPILIIFIILCKFTEDRPLNGFFDNRRSCYTAVLLALQGILSDILRLLFNQVEHLFNL